MGVRSLRLVAAAITIAAVVYGGVAVYGSSPLELKKVEVAGNSNIVASEIARNSGLVRGQHLLEISTARVARRVGSIPWINSARIERVLPSTVRITVVEREPVAVVEVEGRSFLCDEEGVLISEESRDLIRFLDLPIEDPVPGFQIKARQLDHAFAVVRSLEPSLSERVQSVRAGSVDRITLELTGGTLVLYGASEDTEDKNHAISQLVARYQAEGKEILQIDVRVPSRPAVKLR